MFLQQLPLRKNTRKWEYSLAWNWNSANINSKYRLVSDWLVRQLVWFISMVPRGGFLNQHGLLLLMLRSWYMLISFMLMLLGVVFVFIRSKTSSGFVELWGHKVNRQHSQSHVFFSSFDRGGFCTVSSHFSSMRSRNLFCHGSRPLNCYWDLWSWDTYLTVTCCVPPHDKTLIRSLWDFSLKEKTVHAENDYRKNIIE